MIEQSKLGTGRSNLQKSLLLLAGWLPLEFRFYLSSDCAVFNLAETKHKRGEDYSSKKSNNRYLN